MEGSISSTSECCLQENDETGETRQVDRISEGEMAAMDVGNSLWRR